MADSPPKSPAQENTEDSTYVRFLVSHVEAGIVIGKGGSTISDLQSQSGVRITVSRNNEIFLGTPDRIVTVSGTLDGTLKAMDLIICKLIERFSNHDGDDVGYVSLIVPSSCCGGIFGKGAATLRSFKEESQADIIVSPQDNSFHGPNYRVVEISGTIDAQVHAIELILLKMAEDPYYAESFNAPIPYEEAGYKRSNFVSNGTGQKFQNNKVDRNTSVTIGVADEHIGVVVGRGGRNLIEITQVSGARIKISDRNDFLPGTSDRKVTITGSERAIRVAEDMIWERVDFACERYQQY